MLRTLDNTGRLQYVGGRPLAGSADYAIVTELIDFHAKLSADGASADVLIRITSRIVRESDARVISSKTFSARADATSIGTPALIAAFDEASEQLLVEFANWAMTMLGRRLTPV